MSNFAFKLTIAFARVALAALLLALATGAGATSNKAKEGKDLTGNKVEIRDGMVTVDLSERGVPRVLERLAQAAGFELKVKWRGEKVKLTERFEDLPLGEALRRLLRECSYVIQKDDSGKVQRLVVWGPAAGSASASRRRVSPRTGPTADRPTVGRPSPSPRVEAIRSRRQRLQQGEEEERAPASAEASGSDAQDGSSGVTVLSQPPASNGQPRVSVSTHKESAPPPEPPPTTPIRGGVTRPGFARPPRQASQQVVNEPPPPLSHTSGNPVPAPSKQEVGTVPPPPEQPATNTGEANVSGVHRLGAPE